MLVEALDADSNNTKHRKMGEVSIKNREIMPFYPHLLQKG
jgi:hypothetical protein